MNCLKCEVLVIGAADLDKNPGIFKKISDTSTSLTRLNYLVDCRIVSRSLRGLFEMVQAILTFRGNIIWYRFSELPSLILVFLFMFHRMRGCKVIVDIPTPRIIGLSEIAKSDRQFWKKALRLLVSILIGPFTLIPATKIIQYGNESFWFQPPFLTKKTLRLGNGVDPSKIKLSKSLYKANEVLNMAIVAQLAEWHGVDRVIKAISTPSLIGKVQLHVIGDGEILPELRKLAETLNSKGVIFYGKRIGVELDDVLEVCHVGCSSLALFRKGIDDASDLKTREYLARGLTVIGVGVDRDLMHLENLRISVSNSDELVTLTSAIKGIICGEINLLPPSVVRAKALPFIDMTKKVERILR